MSHRLSNILLAALLIVPSAVFAQNPNRSRNPILQPGEGLETSRRELADTHNNKQDKRTEIGISMFITCLFMLPP